MDLVKPTCSLTLVVLGCGVAAWPPSVTAEIV